MFGLGITPLVQLQLLLAFVMVATAYSSAGFGGGSTYSALLAQAGLPAATVPLVSLPCNAVVSGAGFIRFLRRGLVPVRELMLISLVSMPASFFGGRLRVEPQLFFTTLGAVLLFAGLSGVARLVRAKPWRPDDARGFGTIDIVPGDAAASLPVPLPALLVLGAMIGFVSGVAGIGGGIMLSPVLLRYPGVQARSVAALSSGFIFLNSIAGFAGQIAKSGPPGGSALLFIAVLAGFVLAGGSVGTSIALRRSSQQTIRGATGVLLSLVGRRLLV